MFDCFLKISYFAECYNCILHEGNLTLLQRRVMPAPSGKAELCLLTLQQKSTMAAALALSGQLYLISPAAPRRASSAMKSNSKRMPKWNIH